MDVSGFTDDEDILPASPHLPQDGPEERIQSAQGRPGPPPFEDGHLLAEGEYFERRVGAAAQDRAAARNASTNYTTISRFNTL